MGGTDGPTNVVCRGITKGFARYHLKARNKQFRLIGRVSLRLDMASFYHHTDSKMLSTVCALTLLVGFISFQHLAPSLQAC